VKSVAFLLFLSFDLLPAAEPVTRTFFVKGMECGSCVYMVQQSVTATPGVSDANVVQLLDSYANVSYDPKVLSEHQVAQAVREGTALHGTPYLATLKVSVPEFSRHAVKIEAAFTKWKDAVWLDVLDRDQGQLEIHFHELKPGPKKAGATGWSLALLEETLKGIGATCTLVKEG
jgi:copper chaperone CopZ